MDPKLEAGKSKNGCEMGDDKGDGKGDGGRRGMVSRMIHIFSYRTAGNCAISADHGHL